MLHDEFLADQSLLQDHDHTWDHDHQTWSHKTIVRHTWKEHMQGHHMSYRQRLSLLCRKLKPGWITTTAMNLITGADSIFKHIKGATHCDRGLASENHHRRWQYLLGAIPTLFWLFCEVKSLNKGLLHLRPPRASNIGEEFKEKQSLGNRDLGEKAITGDDWY